MVDNRRRFYLVGGRPVRTEGLMALTRTHVAFAPDGDGVFWAVCGETKESEMLAEGVFEELRRQATCRSCQRTREPMLPRQDGARAPRRRWS